MNAETKIAPETAAPLDTSHVTLAIPLDEIMRLKPFISAGDFRPYLEGVRFERSEVGAVLAATDGHRLGVLRVTRAVVNGEGIARLPLFKPKLSRADRKNRQWLVIGEFAGETLGIVVSFAPMADAETVAAKAALGDALLIYSAPLAEGEFPDWRRVLPSKVGRKTAAFNARFLADFSRASGQKSTSVTLYGDSDSEPHLVDIGSKDFIGVLMPMRADELTGLPNWLAQPALPKTRRKKAA